MKKLPQPTPNVKPILRFYARRSTDETTQSGSLDMQRDKCGAIASDRALPWGGRVEYVEADNTCRDEMASHYAWHRLVADLQPGDVVIVYERSRIGADLEYALALRDVCTRGARLIIAATNEEPRMQGGVADIVEVLHGLTNKEELTKLRQRTRDGMRKLVLDGKWPWPAPYACAKLDGALVPGEQKDRAVVHRIGVEYLDGDGCGAIARRLNKSGVECPSASSERKDKYGVKVPVRAAWTADRVSDILRAPVYRGVLVSFATRTVMKGGRHVTTEESADIIRQERPDLAIFSPEMAARIDAAIAARSKPFAGHSERRGRHIVHPLSGYGRCAACGGAISTYRNAKGTTYVCDRWRRVGDCDHRVRVRVEKIEAAIVDELARSVLSAEVLDMVRAGIRGAAEAARFTTRVDPTEIEHKLAQLRAKKTRALRLAVDLGDADAEEEVRALATQIRDVERRLVDARRPVVEDLTVRKAVEAAEREIARLRETVRDRATLRRDLERIFPKGLYFHPLPGDTGWTITGDAQPCTSTEVGTPVAVDVLLPFRVVIRVDQAA